MLRKIAFLQLMAAIIKPLIEFNAKTVYDVQFTPELSSIERYLNDQYNLTYTINNRDDQITAKEIIWIETLVFIQPTYIYNQAEGFQEVHIYNKSENQAPTYIYNQAEINPGYNFIVWVPNYIVYDTPRLMAQIKKYRVAGLIPIIQTY
jgi:hypothetical protein